MDHPIINETSFSAANPSSYSLAEIWSFGNGDSGGGLGLKMGSFTGFLEATKNLDVSVAESTVTDQSGSLGGKKRKEVNCIDGPYKLVSTSSANDLNDPSGKRAKGSGSSTENGGLKVEVEMSSGTDNKPAEQSNKPSEPPKGYIHVRARRGQATDNHSLAERARREKISERMKILQDIVPGCNKVIGKALVLDEIINYIQSLQRQVEFLSMKLEVVNSRPNPTMEGFPSKDLAAPYDDDAAGMIFGSQTPREYTRVPQPEWLHMQVGDSFERAT